MYRILAVKAGNDGIHAIKLGIIQRLIWRRRHFKTLTIQRLFPFGSSSYFSWALIAKVKVVTRRCFDRPRDWSSMFKSVFLLISVMAVSNAHWRKFAQTGKGASWMIFPSESFNDSSPSTFRSSAQETRFVPKVTYFCAL